MYLFIFYFFFYILKRLEILLKHFTNLSLCALNVHLYCIIIVYIRSFSFVFDFLKNLIVRKITKAFSENQKLCKRNSKIRKKKITKQAYCLCSGTFIE